MTAVARVLGALVLLCLCAACAYERNLTESDNPGDIDGEDSGPGVNPQSMSRFAYERIIISDLPFSVSSKVEITVGGLPCVNAVAEGDSSASCMVLPNCGSGPQEIVLHSGKNEITITDAFEFETAGEPLMGGLLAVGGGWMAGARNGALYPEAQLTSIAAYVARQSHSCMPLPLATAEGFPAIKNLDDLDRSLAYLTDGDISSAIEHFMEDESSIYARRQIADEAALIAVPYISAGDEIEGIGLGSRADVFQRFVRPSDKEESIMDEIRRRQPDFIIADFEYFVYSTHTGHFQGRQIEREDIEMRIERFFRAMSMLNPAPYFFVMNVPPLNIFPVSEYSEQTRYENIWINDAIHLNIIRINESLQKKGLGERFFEIDLYGFLYNIALATGRVSVSGQDLPTLTENNEEADLIITDSNGEHQQLGFDLLEGFFSLDGYHPTATGAAIIANLVLERINAELGSQSARQMLSKDLELVDIGATLADDPLSALNIQQSAVELEFFPPEVYQDAQGLPELHTAHYCAIQWGGNIPDYSRCPTKISVLLESNPLIIEPGENVNVRVFLKISDKNKANWPVMAYNSGDGSFFSDVAWTNASGFADFIYTGDSTGGIDSLDFYSGDAFSEHEITVTPAKEGM